MTTSKRPYVEVAKQLALETEETEALDPADDAQGLLGENELNERLKRYERPAEYSETDEGRVMVLSARPRFQNTDAESSQKLCDEVKALADEVAKKFPSIQTELQGSFAEQSKRQKELDDSVVQGSLLALLILLASIGLYFRSLRIVFWSSFRWQFPLWPPSHSPSLYGYLNLVSAFIVAILLGIGIDFGIHIASRYAAERRDGHSVDVALKTALETTGISTFAGASRRRFVSFCLSLPSFKVSPNLVSLRIGCVSGLSRGCWVLPLLLRR